MLEISCAPCWRARSSRRLWDQRVVRAMAMVLRVLGAVVIAGTLVASCLLIYRNEGYGTFPSDEPSVPGRIKFAEFVQTSALPVAFGGGLLALSFLVVIYAARLDLDIVLADNDESGVPGAGGAGRADDSTWSAPDPAAP